MSANVPSQKLDPSPNTRRTAEVGSILVGDRLRPIYPQVVDALAASIESVGLRHSITCRTDHKKRLVIVDGAHRHAALLQLGIDTTEVVMFTGNAREARYAEIEAHLLQGSLTPLDRAVVVDTWRAKYEEDNGVLRRGGDRKSADYRDKIKAKSFRFDFCEPIRERIGLGQRAIERASSIAGMGGDFISRLRHAGVGDLGEGRLYKLARATKEARDDVLRLVVDEQLEFDQAWQRLFPPAQPREGQRAVNIVRHLKPAEQLAAARSILGVLSKTHRAILRRELDEAAHG